MSNGGYVGCIMRNLIMSYDFAIFQDHDPEEDCIEKSFVGLLSLLQKRQAPPKPVLVSEVKPEVKHHPARNICFGLQDVLDQRFNASGDYSPRKTHGNGLLHELGW